MFADVESEGQQRGAGEFVPWWADDRAFPRRQSARVGSWFVVEHGVVLVVDGGYAVCFLEFVSLCGASDNLSARDAGFAFQQPVGVDGKSLGDVFGWVFFVRGSPVYFSCAQHDVCLFDNCVSFVRRWHRP